MTRRLALFLFAVLGLPACTALPPSLKVTPPDDGLARRVARLAARTGARMGISAVHVESGRRLVFNGSSSFEAASVIKLALLAEAVARAKEGSLDLHERFRLSARAVAAGSGILDEFEPGLEPTLRDLLRLMIAVSDNTAANAFIDRFGLGPVNARMEKLGLAGIRLLGRIPDRDPGGEDLWRDLKLGSMTPDATAEFYRRAATGTLLDAEGDRLIRELLKTPHTTDRIPRRVLEWSGTRWSGKSGTLRGVRNDSGILTTPKGRFVIAIFCDRIPNRPQATTLVSETMGEIAAAIVDTWSASLPDVRPAPDEPPRPKLAHALPRVELTPLEARLDSPFMERVLRETDRRFWRLWEEAGGSLSEACLLPTPNSWWDGNDPLRIEPVSALILHHTSQETDEECIALFQKPESLVSAHFLVGRDGRLYQFVSLEHRAWHAGISLLHGRRALNKSSVGVEITGDGNRAPFTRAQVETVVRVVGVLTALFDLKAPWIAGHEHVAPDRKDDPGRLFPWNEVERRGLELARSIRDGDRD